MKTLATIACLAALSSLVLLALVRGDVLAQAARSVTSVVTFSDIPAAQPENNFYDRTLVLLRLLMALLALAMEIGAGLALYEARRLGSLSGDDPARLAAAVTTVEATMVSKLEELKRLENASAVFQNEFWRDFYRALSDGLTRRSLVKLSTVLFCVALFVTTPADAADRLSLIIALDLTQSVAVKGADQKQEFQKNVDAVARLLASSPSGARVTVLGITDRSFSQPSILLSAELSDDAGYLGERLQAARNRLVSAFRHQAASLAPIAPKTDILGALMAVSQIFQASPGYTHVLVVFSDMRSDTPALDLEHARIVSTVFAMQKAEKGRLLPDLHGVEVYALGVDGAGKDMAYWQTPTRFLDRVFQANRGGLQDILASPRPTLSNKGAGFRVKSLYLFLNFILERFYLACGILRGMEKASLQFHIEENDYFGTLATVLDLVSQDLRKKGHHHNAETLLRQRDALMQLQQGYRIEKIDASSSILGQP